jgi:hypothetical protein
MKNTNEMSKKDYKEIINDTIYTFLKKKFTWTTTYGKTSLSSKFPINFDEH